MSDQWHGPAEAGEIHELRARTMELEVEMAALREGYEALEGLLDRVVVFLKSAHGEDSPAFQSVEDAAQEAIRPR